MISDERSALGQESDRIQGSDRKQVSMSWDKACRVAINENLSIRQSEARLKEITRQRKSQWREWLPRPSLYFSLQSSLRGIGDLEMNDINKSFYAPLSIPNPVSMKARAYDYALREVQSQDSHELARRRLVIGLYGLFMDWGDMDANMKFTVGELTIDEEIGRIFSAREADMHELERKERLWERMADMLNRPDENIVPVAKTAPDIDYSQRLESLRPGRNYAKLAYRLSTYEIVGALLRNKGVKIREWPRTSLNSSLPPIYDSNRQGDEWFDEPDQIRLFGSVSKSFDMTGRTAASVKTAEQQVVFIRDQIKLKMNADEREWRRLKERYKSVMLKRSLLKARLEKMMMHDAGDVAREWGEVKTIFQQLRSLERTKRSLDMELWLWDDDAWK